MNNIPILDLRPGIQDIFESLMPDLQKLILSGNFVMGEHVKALEEEISQYLSSKHVITMNSGTDALIIGLRALGVEAGDQVITSAFTFFATGEAVSIIGAEPVFADIDPLTFNIDPLSIKDKLSSKTKAIIPVHLYGQAAEMDAIKEIAQQNNLKILEDAAQAFGAEYKGQKLGTLGMAGAFSFFPTKNLGAFGDGGMLVTDDPHIAKQAQMLRVHGSSTKYHNEFIGMNSRLDEIQALILRKKLSHINKYNASRQQAARLYQKHLSHLPQITLPSQSTDATHIYHQYTIRVPSRDLIYEHLEDLGVQCMIYYPVPLHKLPVYKSTYKHISLPHTEQAASEVLNLPIWPEINEEQIRYICQSIEQALSRVHKA